MKNIRRCAVFAAAILLAPVSLDAFKRFTRAVMR